MGIHGCFLAVLIPIPSLDVTLTQGVGVVLCSGILPDTEADLAYPGGGFSSLSSETPRPDLDLLGRDLLPCCLPMPLRGTTLLP